LYGCPTNFVTVAEKMLVVSPRSHGRLGRETKHRPAETGNVDLRQTIGCLVDVDPSDPSLLRGLEAIGLRHRDVVVPAHSDPRLENERRTECPRVVDRRADHILGAGAGKTTIRRATVDSVRARIEELRLLVAEPEGEGILLRQVVVDLGVELVGRSLTNRVDDKVWLTKRRVGDIRRWQNESSISGTIGLIRLVGMMFPANWVRPVPSAAPVSGS
jgi:hypothetical protein